MKIGAEKETIVTHTHSVDIEVAELKLALAHWAKYKHGEILIIPDRAAMSVFTNDDGEYESLSFDWTYTENVWED